MKMFSFSLSSLLLWAIVIEQPRFFNFYPTQKGEYVHTLNMYVNIFIHFSVSSLCTQVCLWTLRYIRKIEVHSMKNSPLSPSLIACLGNGQQTSSLLWQNGVEEFWVCGFCFVLFLMESLQSQPGSHHVDQAGLHLSEIHLPLPPQTWD